MHQYGLCHRMEVDLTKIQETDTVINFLDDQVSIWSMLEYTSDVKDISHCLLLRKSYKALLAFIDLGSYM